MQVEASCAICGAPPSKKCTHEDARLKRALDEAHQRWMADAEIRQIRHWVLNHSREWVIYTFNQMVEIRQQQYEAHLNSIPCYELYKIYSGRPPISPSQLRDLQLQMSSATQTFQRGVDEDWKNSLTRYPEVLDYYFGLVEFKVPSEKSAAVVEPQFGAAANAESKKKDSRGRRKGSVNFMVPPPAMPATPFGMPGIPSMPTMPGMPGMPGAPGGPPMPRPGSGMRPPPFTMPMHPGPF